jgi:hypothetical protein
VFKESGPALISVYVDEADNVYVGNSEGVITKYTSGSAVDTSWGAQGTIAIKAFSIHPDGMGGLYATDFNSSNGNTYKILQISPNGQSTSNFIEGLNSPTGIARDNNGNFFVLERSKNVKTYNPTGNLLYTYTHASNTTAYGIAVDAFGEVWVADSLSPGKIYALSQDSDTNPPLPPNAFESSIVNTTAALTCEVLPNASMA